MLPDPWVQGSCAVRDKLSPSTQPLEVGIRLLDFAPSLKTELIRNLEVVISPEWALAMRSAAGAGGGRRGERRKGGGGNLPAPKGRIRPPARPGNGVCLKSPPLATPPHQPD